MRSAQGARPRPTMVGFLPHFCYKATVGALRIVSQEYLERGHPMTKKLIAVLAAAALISACTTDPYTGEQKVSNTASGAAIGAGLGALAGMAVGGSKNAQRNAVLIGAGVGALTGGAIGATRDRNEAELRAQLQGTGVSVTRAGDQIILNMPSDITFGVDQDDIKPGFYQTLNSVA